MPCCASRCTNHHLMVSVGGYSARFVNLSPELRAEIVQRRRFNS